MKPACAMSACLLLAAMPLAAAPLVACPDCGESVSVRAVFCPHCGAPGDAIAEAAAAPAETAEAAGDPEETAEDLPGESEPVPPADNVLFARINGRDAYALPVAWPDGPCAILPAAALADLETLELVLPSTALPVSYGAPSVSRDGRLVRLPLSDGVPPLALHPLAGADDGFVFDTGVLPPAGTSPVAAVRVPGTDDIPLSAAILWQTVSPRALKSILNQKESP